METPGTRVRLAEMVLTNRKHSNRLGGQGLYRVDVGQALFSVRRIENVYRQFWLDTITNIINIGEFPSDLTSGRLHLPRIYGVYTVR
eukprot:COSAG02_NODE_23069_length_731_cov_1.047468_1_plen_87_part_00